MKQTYSPCAQEAWLHGGSGLRQQTVLVPWKTPLKAWDRETWGERTQMSGQVMAEVISEEETHRSEIQQGARREKQGQSRHHCHREDVLSVSPILTNPLDHVPPAAVLFLQVSLQQSSLKQCMLFFFPVSLLPFSHSVFWPQDHVEPALAQVMADLVSHVPGLSFLVYSLLLFPRLSPLLVFLLPCRCLLPGPLCRWPLRVGVPGAAQPLVFLFLPTFL